MRMTMDGQSVSALPGTSDLSLFRYRERVIHLDAEISDRALDLGVTEQELDGSQVAGAPIDQGSLRPAQRVGAEQLGVEPDAGDPPRDEPRVLARRHALAAPAAARE